MYVKKIVVKSAVLGEETLVHKINWRWRCDYAKTD